MPTYPGPPSYTPPDWENDPTTTTPLNKTHIQASQNGLNNQVTDAVNDLATFVNDNYLAIPSTPTIVSAIDAPGNAAFDGVTDDHAAITNSEQGNSTVWFPSGIGQFTGASSATLNKTKQTIRGQGMHSTILRGANASLFGLFQAEFAPNYVSEVTISDMTFDGGNLSPAAIYAELGTIGRLNIQRCRFINFPAQIIAGGFASEIVIEDCIADGSGSGLGMFFTSTNKDLEVLIARRNKLRWLEQGFLLGSSSGCYQAHLEISQNYFDFGWWLLKSLASNSGGTVTYTSTAVTDSAAAFGTGSGTVQIGMTVRAMTARHTGTKTSGSGITLIDSAGAFTSSGTLRGEIVRSGTKFGVVSNVEGATICHVEEWLDQTTYQPVAPPATGDSYTVWGLLLGVISAVSAHTLTVNSTGVAGWFDMTGTRTTPSSGTLYEVASNPTYPIQTTNTCDGMTINGNTVRRGWGDCISIFGTRAIITGNLVEDGYDTGITLQGGTGSVVVGNRIRHCGSNGIIMSGGTDLEVGPNICEDNTWVHTGDNASQISVFTGTTGTIRGRAYASGTASISPYGIYLNTGVAGVTVDGFAGHGHVTADVYVATGVAVGANKLLDVDGTIVYQSSGNGQITRSPTGAVNLNSQSAGYTFTLADIGAVVEGTSGSGQTYTIPTNATSAFPIGTVIGIFQAGAGQITIAAAGGVTLQSDGALVKTAAQFATVGLRKRATNTWCLSGDLA